MAVYVFRSHLSYGHRIGLIIDKKIVILPLVSVEQILVT